MKITYQLSNKDIIALNVSYLDQSPEIKKILKRKSLTMPLIMLFASYPMSLYFKQDLITTALIMSMFSATYYIFYPNLFKKNLIKLGVKNSQNVIGQNSLELRDEYLIAHQPDTETKVEWRSILKVDETSNHLFLYLKEGSVFIVPLAQINAFEKSELINFLSVKKDILLNVLN